MESRNSGDYMELDGIVKARRRQILTMNTLIQPVKTPLFPTGELHILATFLFGIFQRLKDLMCHEDPVAGVPGGFL